MANLQMLMVLHNRKGMGGVWLLLKISINIGVHHTTLKEDKTGKGVK